MPISLDDYRRKKAGNSEHASKSADADIEHMLESLADMSPAEYGRQRQDIASKTGIALKYLDTEYEDRRKNAKVQGGATVQLAHWQVEPWPDPVDGAGLIHDIQARLKRHVVMSDEAALAVALWIVFTWVHEAAVHSPILLVSSPEAECGKSTLLGLVSFLVPKGLTSVEVTPAVLYRMIECWHPTLIVDEADTAFKNNPELRSVINSGWTRGTGVPRCRPETHEPELFETFGPMAVGLKGLKVPDTTLTRSIVIEMARKLPSDRAESFAHADDDELAEMRQRLARFAADNLESLKASSPQMPDGFNNRLAANWKLLLAIAETCNVGEEARQAATALSRRSDEGSLGVELLRDIREIFGDHDRIRSQDLVNKLQNMEERPWSEMPFTNKAITQRQLAKMLKPYGVHSAQVRFGDMTLKGYKRECFDEAFRYIPDDHPAPDPQTGGNTETTADY